MKNLLHEPKSHQNLAYGLGILPATIILIAFYFFKLIVKLLNKFKVYLFKLSLMTGVVFFLTAFFMPVAGKAEADLSQPYSPKFSVDLPMKVTPDMQTREIVLSLVRVEFGEDQVNSFDQIVIHESGWDPKAVNPNGGACGLFQSLPCSKMGGMDLHSQINFGFDYIKNRYGNPNNAWAFWKEHGWY